jgi:NAD(P)-dependent dehydrogenase (short-subunit alcohol dehydrogenase family)
MNLKVNLYGMSHGVFLAIERMGRSNGGKGGRIVNVSSGAGLSVHFSCFNLTYCIPQSRTVSQPADSNMLIHF